MNTDRSPDIESLTGAIIGASYRVSNTLGHGFLESVYRNALILELGASGLATVKEKPFNIFYRGTKVGHYVADIVVEEQVVVELKVVDALAPTHYAQLLNYLRASGLQIGLLINFGQPKVETRRVLL